MAQMDENSEDSFSFLNGESSRRDKLKRIRELLTILAMLILTTVLNYFLERFIQPSSLVFVYLVPTIAGAIFFGNWASILSFTCGFVVFDFWFVEPYYSLHISKPQDIYNVTVYFTIAALITYLINIVRRQNAFLKNRIDRVSLIEDMSKDFLWLIPLDRPGSDMELSDSLRTRVLSQLGHLVLKYTTMIMNVPAIVFFRDEDETLKIWAKNSLVEITEKERAAANWTLSSGEVSGSGTNTNADTPYFFMPMSSVEKVIGVLGIRFNSKDLFPEQRRLLGTVSNLATIVASRWMNGNKDS